MSSVLRFDECSDVWSNNDALLADQVYDLLGQFVAKNSAIFSIRETLGVAGKQEFVSAIVNRLRIEIAKEGDVDFPRKSAMNTCFICDSSFYYKTSIPPKCLLK